MSTIEEKLRELLRIACFRQRKIAVIADCAMLYTDDYCRQLLRDVAADFRTLNIYKGDLESRLMESALFSAEETYLYMLRAFLEADTGIKRHAIPRMWLPIVDDKLTEAEREEEIGKSGGTDEKKAEDTTAELTGDETDTAAGEASAGNSLAQQEAYQEEYQNEYQNEYLEFLDRTRAVVTLRNARRMCRKISKAFDKKFGEPGDAALEKIAPQANVVCEELEKLSQMLYQVKKGEREESREEVIHQL